MTESSNQSLLPPESFKSFTSELLQNYQPLEKLENREFESFRDDHFFILWLINDKKISREEINEVVRRDVLAITRYKKQKRGTDELPPEIEMPQIEMASLTQYFEALTEHDLLNTEQFRFLRENGGIFSNKLIDAEIEKRNIKKTKEPLPLSIKEQIDLLSRTIMHYRTLLVDILNPNALTTNIPLRSYIFISTTVQPQDLEYLLRDDTFLAGFLSEDTLAFLSNFPFLKKFLPVSQRKQTGVHAQTNNLQPRSA